MTFGVHPLDTTTAPVLSHEHKEIGLFARAEIPDLFTPDGYKRSIETWFDHPRRP
ncbi:hypothetical protein [Streptomyces sp. SID3343]|uniref:hypothetical protein n=1 Tax=Streptomyces sp. SID3343 TaxID=2690260 RepID=UPI001F2224CD|nr:hypothetical protein [Streptomyces sp. SID3343]